ncbi:hypothetical protein E2C01_035505 [Portunus trituberculatus]|uniref:Uncharacterized protein n=1 Tax=Portunus trituberculatus TaxID=210409 RepID=A0A5B7F8M4_PORTR|nr:hypothetical protein [Portunus trituberculatus]
MNRSEDESNAVWRTGENEMNQAREYKYLGMWVSPSGCEKTKNEKRLSESVDRMIGECSKNESKQI